jgi:DNA-binding CsgD family transcriptional regulator
MSLADYPVGMLIAADGTVQSREITWRMDDEARAGAARELVRLAQALDPAITIITVGRRAAGRPRRDVGLTAREVEVLALTADGLTTEQAGKALFLAENTCKMHRHRLFRKLGAVNAAHAVALGFRAGILT